MVAKRLLLLFPFCPAALAAEMTAPPALTGSVTISYAELRTLIDSERAAREELTRHAAPVAPPLAHCWHSVTGTLTLGENGGTLDWSATGETLASGWNEVFLLGGNVSLVSSDTAGAPLVWKNGFHLLLDKPGPRECSLHLASPGWRTLSGETPLILHTAAATVKRFTIKGIPQGMEAVWTGGVTRPADDANAFLLPPAETTITLSLRHVRPEKPAAPAVWRADNRIIARPGEGRLEYSAAVTLNANSGSGLTAALTLPAGAFSITATGADLQSHATTPAADGSKLLNLRWKSDALTRDIIVQYSLPVSPLAERWQLRAPATAGETKCLYAIVTQQGMQLEGPALRNTPPARLGTWMRETLARDRFVTAEGGHSLDLAVRWLPVVAAAEATVSEVKAAQRLVEDGSTRTDVSWLIRHSAAHEWTLEMPPGIELLACSVGGQPMKPVSRKAGEYEIPLPAPEPGQTGTLITLSYAASAGALNPVSGSVSLSLPRTRLFIERVEWALALPPRYEVAAVEGNVSVAGPPIDGVLPLRRALCRGEKPAITLYYQRAAVTDH
ncbi:MAG: hypothetical protein V4733_10970 [Verrucomicrobiota bacterium]